MMTVAQLQQRGLCVFFALDHAILAIFTLGNCKHYEMISSALWSLDQDGRVIGRVLRPVVDFLLRPLGADHCRNSWEWQRSLYENPTSTASAVFLRP